MHIPPLYWTESLLPVNNPHNVKHSYILPVEYICLHSQLKHLLLGIPEFLLKVRSGSKYWAALVIGLPVGSEGLVGKQVHSSDL